MTYCDQFSCHVWWDVDFDRLWYVYPCSSQSFLNESIARVSWRSITVTNKSNCLTCTVASRTSPLAVITVVGLLWCPHGLQLNSAELRSFSLTICILTPESTTNSLSSSSLAEALGRTHFSAGEKNVALSFALSLYICLARSQALLWAHRSCLSVSSWDRSSNFTA